jgi:hypothetical protein
VIFVALKNGYVSRLTFPPHFDYLVPIILFVSSRNAYFLLHQPSEIISSRINLLEDFHSKDAG